MDASEVTFVLLVLTLAPPSHQWTSHGSIQFLSEGESTLLDVPGDSSAGCWWMFTHSDGVHSCCYASHPHLYCNQQSDGKTDKCRTIANAEVKTEANNVPACTLSLENLSESVDKGNYKAIFPANLDDGLEVSLWIFTPPGVEDQPVRENQPGSFITFCKVFCS